jgi:predicted nucleotidyltransferase
VSESKFGLPDQTLDVIRNILAQEPAVMSAILFGSRAKGTHRAGSDIDVALVGEGLDIDALGRLTRAFEESSIPYQVDLCWLAAIDHPPLREHIERVGQVLYERLMEPERGGADG